MSDILADRPLTQPHPERLPTSAPAYDEILARHSVAMESGDPGYVDPLTGLYVMTASYHADRGVCCGNGCRHCPYVD